MLPKSKTMIAFAKKIKKRKKTHKKSGIKDLLLGQMSDLVVTTLIGIHPSHFAGPGFVSWLLSKCSFLLINALGSNR